jgi:hypothetical protein
LWVRSVVAGYFCSKATERNGRGLKPPPQFGHTSCSFVLTQSMQNVHSNEQIIASVESGGRSLSQHSQPGRICNMVESPKHCGRQASIFS